MIKYITTEEHKKGSAQCTCDDCKKITKHVIDRTFYDHEKLICEECGWVSELAILETYCDECKKELENDERVVEVRYGEIYDGEFYPEYQDGLYHANCYFKILRRRNER